MKTYSTKLSDIERQWHVIDARDKVLGKLATQAVGLLMGKHKPIFCRNLDTGDFVVVINADKVQVTGNKTKQKLYYRHSGYPGGLKSVTLEKMMQTKPTRVIEHAVKGMLPHNRLGASMLKKLRVYVGDTHPHLAQTKATSDMVAESGLGRGDSDNNS
ncbi:50S ribosomal protein L13 [Chloroflexota bacterium]